MVYRRWTGSFRLILWSLIFLAGICYAENTLPASPQIWVYQALEELRQAGYLADFPSQWVNSGNELSRFELAYYIKEIITGKLKNDSGNQIELSVQAAETLQKLISEFSVELADLGIKITDLSKLSPNLIPVSQGADGYQDLDQFLGNTKQTPSAPSSDPCYYFGQYYQSLERKSFIFIPLVHLNSEEISILDGDINGINILYQNKLGEDYSFLVVKGELPFNGGKSIAGYYLFPIDQSREDENLIRLGADNTVLSLLGEVNQIQQIENLWRFEGLLSLSGYSLKKTELQTRLLLGSFNQGLKVGSLFIYTENPSSRGKFEANNFGLPFYHTPATSVLGAIDLDKISANSLDSVQLNIQGTKALNPQTAVYGGLELLYRSSNVNPLFESFWPSDAKASAALSYQMNDYWTVLTYQSFVNSQVNTGVLSTTSIGVEYNDWVTLWLAYQLLNFDDPVLTGALTFRF